MSRERVGRRSQFSVIRKSSVESCRLSVSRAERARYGALMDIILGIVGAVIGGYLMRLVGFAGSGGMIYTIIVAVIGAVILT